jgi:hypothetical protein
VASLAEYFSKNRYLPKYHFGERVYGFWNKIPFIGTVYGDSVISELQGPRLTIQLDLPIIVDGKQKLSIIDTHKSFKKLSTLKNFDALEADRIARASKTPGSGFDSHQAHQKKTRSSKVKGPQ